MRIGSRSVSALVAAVLSCCAACTGNAQRPQVAALSDRGATSAANESRGSAADTSGSRPRGDGAIPDPGGRPRETLDLTTHEDNALYQPWKNCLVRHGLASKSTGMSAAQVRSGFRSCHHLQPLPPWPLDPANPQARAVIGRTVSCLRGRGYRAQAVQRGADYTGTPGVEFWGVEYSPSIVGIRHRTERDEAACEQQATK